MKNNTKTINLFINSFFIFAIIWSALFMSVVNQNIQTVSAHKPTNKNGETSKSQSPTKFVGINPQPAIITTTDSSNNIVYFPDPENSPTTQILTTGLPANAVPHGASFFSSDKALIADSQGSRIFVVEVTTGTLLSTIDTSAVGYDGTGTIAVAPNRNMALAMGAVSLPNDNLYVIEGPFDQSPTIKIIKLPNFSRGATAQTQDIVFDKRGRAFVYHLGGISVLDDPYKSIAFTIPFAINAGGAIAISPNGNTLLATVLTGNQIRVIQAPFSVNSPSTNITVPGGNGLDGIEIAPDGSGAIVTSGLARHAAHISAPFSSTSTVTTIPLPAGGGTDALEDVGISADSQTAIITGNSFTDPAILIKAPFNAAVTSLVPIENVANPARGQGAARFLPPGLAPGLTVSKSVSAAAILKGENLTYTISYKNTGSNDVNNVIIRDQLPANTLLLSASNNGTQIGNDIVFNVGTLIAGGSMQTVTFTVKVNEVGGKLIKNNNYTIQGDGTIPINGPPIITEVLLGPPCASLQNLTPISIPQTGNSGPSNPFPSEIEVPVLNGVITNVTVRLKNFTHITPDDLDVLLVGPGGENAIIMSDVGGFNDANDLTITLDDADANSFMPDSGTLTTGTFKPTNIGANDTWSSPAPMPSGNTELSVFDDTNSAGTWSLFIQDDLPGVQSTGSFAGGWELIITTSDCLAPTAANVSISGRAINSSGRGISNQFITLSGGVLNEPLFARTNLFGHFRFSELGTGQTYILSIESKRYVFANPTRIVTAHENIGGIIFSTGKK